MGQEGIIIEMIFESFPVYLVSSNLITRFYIVFIKNNHLMFC